jgi:hydroxymethylbilane synthase
MPSPPRPLRLGTRGSPLALAQAHLVAAALCTAHGWGEAAVAIVPITTTGDVVQDRPLAEIGGKALWTKELDRALGEGRTDFSVHSMKDVETFRPAEFTLAAFLPREDTLDRLIGADSVDALPQGAVVGTSAPRRKAQLLARRPDLQIVPIRGNVQTRLGKVGREVDATLLAAAGLNRLGMGAVGVPILEFLPAPAQGVVGVEVLAANHDVVALLAAIDHRGTRMAVEAERAFLAALGGDCRSAVAAHASSDADFMMMKAQILSPDGAEVHEGAAQLNGANSPHDLARDLLGRASPALRGLFTP